MDVLDRFERFYHQLGQGSADLLPEIYGEQIVFIDPVASHTGLPALKAYFRNLMQNCRSCRVDMTIHRVDPSTAFVPWVMRFEHAQLLSGRPITVDGVSELAIDDDKIVRQRDYYDMGAMIYENVPLLGLVVTGLRRRMAP